MSYFSKFFAWCVTGARNLLFLLDNSFFLDVHEQKIADHCGYPQQSQTRSNVENCVLQIEFPSLALHIDDKLDSVHFVERSTMFLVIFGMPKVPSKIVQDAKGVMGQAIAHEIPVQIAIPGDGNGYHTTSDGNSVIGILGHESGL